MTTEKRKQRAYKCTDTVYEKARKRAAKERTTTAQKIEQMLQLWGSNKLEVPLLY